MFSLGRSLALRLGKVRSIHEAALGREAMSRSHAAAGFFVLLAGGISLPPLLARADSLFIDPYHNKVERWTGTEIVNALDPSDKVTGFTADAIGSANAPIAWMANEVIVLTESGKVLGISTAATPTLRTIYTSADHCQANLNFSGCIYSGVSPKPGLLYFLEHDPQGNDSLMELTAPSSVRKLVHDIPGPSGPIWIRPNGNLGALPYGQGLLEIPIPAQDTALTGTGFKKETFLSAAAFAVEGETIPGHDLLALFDFSAIQLRSTSGLINLGAAVATAFDPCSGSIWNEDPNDATSVSLVQDGMFSALPVNARACPTAVHWNIVERTGSQQNADRPDLIQGYPSGSPAVPGVGVLSLGTQGSITLESDHWIVDGAGPDLRIFENAFQYTGGTFSEPGRVELWDGSQWIPTGCDCAHPEATHCAGMQVTRTRPGGGVLPWTPEAGGLGIDLGAYGVTQTRRIRITDCGQSSTQGGTPGASAGFDLDAAVVTPSSIGGLAP